MVIGTIIQNGIELEHDIGELPYQHSENISIAFQKDTLYEKYMAVACIGYFEGNNITVISKTISESGLFELPGKAFEQDGELSISISLSNGHETIVAGVVSVSIRKAPGISSILPSQVETWQNLVINVVDQYIETNIKKELEDLVKENKNLNSIVKQLEININKAIENVGIYTFSNGILKFKRADGTYGQEIKLQGQTSIFKDNVVVSRADLKTSRNTTSTKTKVQVSVDGNIVVPETTADQVYYKNSDNIEKTLSTYINDVTSGVTVVGKTTKLVTSENNIIDTSWDGKIIKFNVDGVKDLNVSNSAKLGGHSAVFYSIIVSPSNSNVAIIPVPDGARSMCFPSICNGDWIAQNAQVVGVSISNNDILVHFASYVNGPTRLNATIFYI